MLNRWIAFSLVTILVNGLGFYYLPLPWPVIGICVIFCVIICWVLFMRAKDSLNNVKNTPIMDGNIAEFLSTLCMTDVLIIICYLIAICTTCPTALSGTLIVAPPTDITVESK